MPESHTRQTTLDLAPAHAQTPATLDLTFIRNHLAGLITEARTAPEPPWSSQRLDVNRILFRQMSGALPEPERDQLRHAFAEALARFGIDPNPPD